MTQDEVLHSAFNIETHKKTFINYLEVVITSDGVIHYAIPSHQEFCISYAIQQGLFKSREALYKYFEHSCFDIEQMTHCCLVWTNHIRGYVNDDIARSLQDLIQNNLLLI